MANVLNTLQTGNHAGRPTSGLAYGSLYSCTTHSLIYQTTDDGTTWGTWGTLGAATTVATDAIFDAKGDLAVGTGANTSAKLTVGANDTIPMADSGEATGIKWVASASPSAVGTAAATGTADTFTRGDHVHAHEAAHIAHDTIFDAAGDLVIGTGADTAARLAIGSNTHVLTSNGTTAAWAAPSGGTGNLAGTEMDYVAVTSGVSITATTEGGADTVVTSSSVAYDGSTIVMIDFFSPDVRFDANAAGDSLIILLYDDATLLGRIHTWIAATAASESDSVFTSVRRTPTAASHVFTVKAFRTAASACSINGGAGGSATDVAMYIRVTRVTA